MAKPTISELHDVLRQLATEAQMKKNPKPTLKAALMGVMPGAVNKKLQELKFDPLEPLEISLQKTALANIIEPPKPPAPFKSAYPSVKEYSFQYWFNYFYVELPNLSRKQYYYDLITKPDGSFLDEKDLDRKKLLEDMRKEGFEKFTISEKVDPEILYKDSAKNFALQRQGVRVVFRGDGRTPRQIEDNHGTLPQSRIEYLRNKTNISEDWHPFKTLGNKVYFRKGFNADNCLFTVVSVTAEFATATKFPMQEELRATNPGALGYSTVEVISQNSGLGTGTGALIKGHMQLQKAEVKALRASKTTIYVVKTTGGWNTQERQMKMDAGSFPEYAFEHLPWIYHLACVPVIRVHYGEDANAGHQIVIEGWSWLQPMPLLQKLLGSSLSVKTLEDYLNDLYAKGNARTGGIVYLPPGVNAPDWKIQRVVKAFTPGVGQLDENKLKSPFPQPAQKPVLQPPQLAKLKPDTSWIKK